MKIIVVGDIHGRDVWKLIDEGFDLFVFIGDYFDSVDIPFERQLKNFRDICEFKRVHGDKVVMLIGNHNFHYMPSAQTLQQRYSGYQDKKQYVISYEFQLNGDLLKAAHVEGGYLFTHAGVTDDWLRQWGWQGEDVAEFVNRMFFRNPEMFVAIDMYGYNPLASPIWVRPSTLIEYAVKGYDQVVGHTRCPRIVEEGIESEQGDRLWFIDVMGTVGEYLVIEDGVTVKKISN